jgi:hypothetical protein
LWNSFTSGRFVLTPAEGVKLMASKKQAQGKKIGIPEDWPKQKPSLEFAKEGSILASLLWRKIMANLTPELQQALLVEKDLAYIWDQLAPSDHHRVPHADLTNESLSRAVGKAEYLLTGLPWGVDIGLPDGFERTGRHSDDERETP